jgi:hypothetical protein
MSSNLEPRLREHELQIEVQVRDLEIRLLGAIASSRNWTIGIVVALLLPIYVMNVTVLIFLYNAKP